MAREIKFRAWNRIENSYIDAYKHWISLTGDSIVDKYGYIDNTDDGDVSIFDIEQYTDLNDKNDVEIYEGDIVRFDSYVTDFSITAEVVYIEEFASFAFSTGKIYYKPSSEYMIIGNVHENPELLK